MIKAEFIKKMKQSNVSKDAEKTIARLKEVWKGLSKAQREQVLDFSGVTKFAIERSYKVGALSAKVVVAIAQVAEIYPQYLTGESDEKTVSGDLTAIVTDFLKELGYKVGKKDIIVGPQQKTPTQGFVCDDEHPTPTPFVPLKDEAGIEFIEEDYEITDLGMITMMAEEVSALLNQGALKKVETLSETETGVLLHSLRIQADFSDYKKAQFELVKYLLLL
ncbi:MAG: hypothetical protein FWE21_09495 [Defluviitaleaceae bacterium]|nr:hypothetical protein [Defluviitaleaceae bacterium]